MAVKPKPVSVAAFRGNAVGMLVGAWMWLVLVPLIGKMPVLSLAAVVFAVTQIGFVLRAVGRINQAAEQVRLNGRAALVACGLQSLLVVVAQVFYRDEWASIAGRFPAWAIIVFLLAVGLFTWRATERNARRIETAPD